MTPEPTAALQRRYHPALKPLFMSWEQAWDKLPIPPVETLYILCDAGPMSLGCARHVQLNVLCALSQGRTVMFGVLQDELTRWFDLNVTNLLMLLRQRSPRRAKEDDIARFMAQAQQVMPPEQLASSELLVLTAQETLGASHWRFHIQNSPGANAPLKVAVWQGDVFLERVFLAPLDDALVALAFDTPFVREANDEADVASFDGLAPQTVGFSPLGDRVFGLIEARRLGAVQLQAGMRLEQWTLPQDGALLAIGWAGRQPVALLELEDGLKLWSPSGLVEVGELTHGQLDATKLGRLYLGRCFDTEQGQRWIVRGGDGAWASGLIDPQRESMLRDAQPLKGCLDLCKIGGSFWQLRERSPQPAPSKHEDALYARMTATLADAVERLPKDAAQVLAFEALLSDDASRGSAYLPLPVLPMSGPRLASLVMDRFGRYQFIAQIDERRCWAGALVATHWQDRYLFELPPGLKPLSPMPATLCAEEMGFIATDQETQRQLWFVGKRFERLLWRCPASIVSAVSDVHARHVAISGQDGQLWLYALDRRQLIFSSATQERG